MLMNIRVFWDTTPSRLVSSSRRFWRACLLLLVFSSSSCQTGYVGVNIPSRLEEEQEQEGGGG